MLGLEREVDDGGERLGPSKFRWDVMHNRVQRVGLEPEDLRRI